MNWTGGRLQRHSSATVSAKNRQMQHFLKVQHNLRNGAKKRSPMKWSIFNLVVEDYDQELQPSLGQRTHGKAPYHERSYSIASYHSNPLVSGVLAQTQHERTTLHPAGLVGNQTHRATLTAQERVIDNDLYHTTPILKRKRAASESISDRASSIGQTREDESIQQKRRKILEKEDWVGLGIQKPLKLAFVFADHEENIGKRRMMGGSRHARFRDSMTRISSPFSNRKHLRGPYNPDREIGHDRRMKSDVRISVGGRVVPPGISSSSVHKNGSQSSINYRRSQTISSDVMLLDNDQIQLRDASLALNTPSEYGSERSSSTDNKAGYQNQIGTIQPKLGDGQNASSEHIKINQRYTEICSNSEDGIRKSSANVYMDKNPREDFRQGRLIFSSSSASIQHPKPRSSKVSILVFSDLPDSAGSTVAQVGNPKPVVPSSQVLDNEIWTAGMVSDEIEFQSVDYGRSKTHRTPSVSISPGVSMAPRVQSTTVLQDEDFDNYSELESHEYEEVVKGLSLSRSSSRNLSKDYGLDEQMKRDSGISLPTITDFRNPIRPCPVKAHQASKVLQETLLRESANKDQGEEDDTDDTWRKFVFGSSGNEEADIYPNPSEVWSNGEYLTRLSNVAQPATVRSLTLTTSIKTAGTYCPTNFDTPKRTKHHMARNPDDWSMQDASPNRDGVISSDSLSTSMAAYATSDYDSRLLESEDSSKTKRRDSSTRLTPFVGLKVSREYITENLHIRPRLGINLGNRTSRKMRKTNIGVQGQGTLDEDIERDDKESIEGY